MICCGLGSFESVRSITSGLLFAILVLFWPLSLDATESANEALPIVFSSEPVPCEESAISARGFRKRFSNKWALEREDFCYFPKHMQPQWTRFKRLNLHGFSKRIGDGGYLFVLTELHGSSIWARVISPLGTDLAARGGWRSWTLTLPEIDLRGNISSTTSIGPGVLNWNDDADALTWTRCSDVISSKTVYICSKMTYFLRSNGAKLLKFDGLRWGSGQKKDQWDLLWQEGQWTETGRALREKPQ